jgi:hypothetical protein
MEHVASSPGFPIFFNARERKEGEPEIQCHMRDVGPYASVGRVADRENCAWVSTIFMHSGSVWVKKKATLTICEGSTILRGLTELRSIDQQCQVGWNRCFVASLAQRHFTNVYHVTLDPRLPLFSLAYVEKDREAWGRGYGACALLIILSITVLCIWTHLSSIKFKFPLALCTSSCSYIFVCMYMCKCVCVCMCTMCYHVASNFSGCCFRSLNSWQQPSLEVQYVPCQLTPCNRVYRILSANIEQKPLNKLKIKTIFSLPLKH